MSANTPSNPSKNNASAPTDEGEHVLLIMGQYRTLPKEMEWRSMELEAAIASSQELLAEPEVDPEVGAFASIGALPSLIGVRNNPNGRKLEDLVPIMLARAFPPGPSRPAPRAARPPHGLQSSTDSAATAATSTSRPCDSAPFE